MNQKNFFSKEDNEVLTAIETQTKPKQLSEDVLSKIDTALANDAYYSLQSFLKYEDDDYNDNSVELNNEEDRELFLRVRALHHERCYFLNNRARYGKKYQGRLLKIKRRLDYLGINLNETKAVYEENELEWRVY